MSRNQLQTETNYTSLARQVAYTAIISLAFGLLSSSIIDAFLKKWSGTAFNAEIPYSFEKTLAYEVPRPYAYRVLFPWMVNTTAEFLPSNFVLSPPPEMLRRGVEYYIGEQEAKKLPVVLQLKFVIAALWMFVFLFGALWLYRTIAIRALHIDRANADLATLLFGLFLPLSFRGGGGFIYDFSELFFSAAYVSALVSGQYFWSATILFGAIVNKESNLLLLLYLIAHLLTNGRSVKNGWYRFLGHSISAAIPYLLIKLAMADKPGGTVEFNLLWNIDYWTKASSFVGFMTTNLQLVLFPKPTNIAFLVVFAWFIAHHWSRKPPFVRATLVSTGLVSVVLLAIFCWHDEIRNLSLAFPAIFLAITHSFLESYRSEQNLNGQVTSPPKAVV
ncbi:MAG: hypothetical protein H8K10_05655 [Nitrospira sp.]|nr:hypothetical protein [Nitrospira sp.]